MLVLTSERKNFNRPYSHAHAEDDPGDGFLGLALAVSEHQATDHDCDQRQPGRNRAGKAVLSTLTALSHGSLPVLWAYTGTAARKSSEGASHLRQCVCSAARRGRGRFM